MVRMDNGHEFQALFHWHPVIERARTRCFTPRHNGNVERSHWTDKWEFYQLFEYEDDADPNRKMGEGERSSNLHRPHTSHNGKTLSEVTREKSGA